MKKYLSHAEILQELEGLLTGHWITDLANTVALVFQHYQEINWVGFYLYESDSKKTEKPALWLGPFQGLPACTMIPYGKGVCGKAAVDQKTLLVDDVDQFPGHIVCDSRSRSEIAVPLISKAQQILGILDVDSAQLARFKSEDLAFFESVVGILLKANP